jgi:MurNAc alpha-1-phosphate uridylyltransferase
MPEVLETGGGLKNALPLLGVGPVLTLNSDVVFTGDNPVTQLLAQWDAARMDALMIMIPREQAIGHSGTGDFYCSHDGALTRRGTAQSAPYVFGGVQIIKTEGLHRISEKAFSLNQLWDQMAVNERLFGAIYNGGWVDVGRPDGIAAAEQALADV